MSQQTKHFYEFDRFRIDIRERVLLCDGEITPLTQKAFEVLVALVERHGGIVSKEDLMEKVWPDTFVEESNLAQNIYTLRKALGQAPNGDGYIATIPRRGYRFVGSVRELSESAASKDESTDVKTDITIEAQAPSADTTAPVPAVAVTSPESTEDPILEEKFAVENRARAGAMGVTPRARIIYSILAILIIVAIGAGFFNQWRSRGSSSKNMTVAALTTSGNVLASAISPDGAYVAYATSEKSDQSALWIEQLSTSTRRAIVPAAQQRYYALSFSPDGGHVYYIAATNESRKRTVYRVSVLGGQSKPVLEDINLAVSFSPDGKKIVARRAIDTRRSILLTIADPDGKNETEVASIRYPGVFYDPAWSPDGKTIACAAGDPGGVADMYVVGVRTGDWSMKTISTRRWKWIGQMAWLADSRSLVMVAQERSATPRQIWRLDFSNGEARRITNDANTYNRLSLSAEEGIIAAMHVKQVSNVWMIPSEAPDRARQITLAAGGYRGALSWTPDHKLVYESEASASPSISIMQADGSDAKLLTGELTGRAYAGHMVVSPDGRNIIFTSDLNGERHLWRMNIDGGAITQLTKGTGEDHPSCSPDGRWVYYTRLERPHAGLPMIGRVSIDGGDLKHLTDDFTAFPAVSPDGKFFACLYAEGPGPFPWRIAVYPIEGGRPIKLFSRSLESQTVSWTPDGRGLTYRDNPASGASKLWTQPLDGGEPRQLAAFDNDQIFGQDWSRDGKYLALVRGLWATNVVIIRNFD